MYYYVYINTVIPIYYNNKISKHTFAVPKYAVNAWGCILSERCIKASVP